MATFALSLTALVLVALLLGVHVTGRLVLNPALRGLDAHIYVRVKHSIDRTAPRLAKPLMLACLTLTTAALIAAAVVAGSLALN